MGLYRVSAAVLLFSLIIGAALAAQATPAVLKDEYKGYLDWRDLRLFKVWDNGTHLLLEWDWWGSPPSGEPWCWRQVVVGLDIDNNRYTGMDRGSLSSSWAGAEFHIWVNPPGYYPMLWVDIWRADGIFIGDEQHDEWVVLWNETSLVVAVPLDWLNLRAGDTVAILNPMAIAGSQDGVSSIATNWTVPAADIVVDGNDADWAGVPAFATDTNDQYSLEEQYANITEAYVAANGTHLFLAFRMGGPLDPAINNYDWWLYYRFKVDVDNNGTWDYEVWVGNRYVWTWLSVYNFTEQNFYWYLLGDPGFPLFSGLNTTGFVELAVDPSILGLLGDMRGRNITLEMWRVDLNTHDDSGWFRIFYTVGSGGYVAVAVDQQEYVLDPGVQWVVFGGLNLTLNVSGTARLYLWEYGVEPTGNASLPPGYGALSSYYVLWFNNPGAVSWPVHLEVNVSGAQEVPVLMYYSKTSGAYLPVADQAYDPAAGVLRANLSLNEYLAGDEPVLVVAGKPAVVGGTLEPRREAGSPDLLLAAVAAVLALAGGAAAWRLRKD